MNTPSADIALLFLLCFAVVVVAVGLRRFFKTAPGQYGHGDIFLGICVPQLRALLPAYQNMELAELARLLASPLHEARLLALLLLVRRFIAATAATQHDLYHFYFDHIGHINNWDLVDASAPPLVGGCIGWRDQHRCGSGASPSSPRCTSSATMISPIRCASPSSCSTIAKICSTRPAAGCCAKWASAISPWLSVSYSGTVGTCRALCSAISTKKNPKLSAAAIYARP